MNDLVQRAVFDPVARFAAGHLLDAAVRDFSMFVLVLVRMSGLMTIGPLFGQALVPRNVRVLLVIALSLLVAPTLHDQSGRAFARLDANQDGSLSREEAPPQLLARFDALVARAGKQPGSPLARQEFFYAFEPPATAIDLVRIGVGEFALGLVLGLGVLTILSGLQLAGELFDQQSGLALGEVANPSLEINGSTTGQFLLMLGTTVFLLMEPLGGHLMMVQALVETFQTLPVGEAYVPAPAVDLLRDLVHQSLVLGVQVAAPMIAVMTLVAITMGFLGHTVPQINVLVIGFPVRAMICMFVLALTVSGAARAAVDTVPVVIDSLRAALMGA